MPPNLAKHQKSAAFKIGPVRCCDLGCWEVFKQPEAPSAGAWQSRLLGSRPSRGFDHLERAELVSPDRMPGRPPVVAILNAITPNG